MKGTVFLRILAVALIALLLPAGCTAPGSTPGADSETPSSTDETKIDLSNVLTKDAAEDLAAWLKEAPQTYEAITEKYGKPRQYQRTGEMSYRVETNGTLSLKPTDEGGKLYGTALLEWTEEPKTDLTLEQFQAFRAGETTMEAVQKSVGVPHDYIGSGIVRDLYYTADGLKISVYYSEGLVYEILIHNDDGSRTVLTTQNPNA